MKKTAHGSPILIVKDQSKTIEKVNNFSEKQIQDLVFKHPDCLPISDIDESYNPVIPICTELWTPAGPLDIFMITPNGDIVIIENKLWRNPEARRKVIAQVLDYAKEIAKWSYSDLQREVNKRTKLKGNSLYNVAAKAHPNLNLSEDDFVDSVSRNLRIGKFLLLIVGDGIREGAKEIAEFISQAGNLNFRLAMVELSIFKTEDSGYLICPRTTVKTTEIQKINIELPEGLKIVQDNVLDDNEMQNVEVSTEVKDRRAFYSSFWGAFTKQLNLDDPGQPLPGPMKAQNLFLYPGNNKGSWISAYFSTSIGQVGVYYRFSSNHNGQAAKEALSVYRNEIQKELGQHVLWTWDENLTNAFSVSMPLKNIKDPNEIKKITEFFNKWINEFVNVIRPRLKQLN